MQIYNDNKIVSVTQKKIKLLKSSSIEIKVEFVTNLLRSIL